MVLRTVVRYVSRQNISPKRNAPHSSNREQMCPTESQVKCSQIVLLVVFGFVQSLQRRSPCWSLSTLGTRLHGREDETTGHEGRQHHHRNNYRSISLLSIVGKLFA